jgi:hypothetical protein
MKKLAFSLVIFSIIFLISCRDNSITNPIDSKAININNPSAEIAPQNIIQIDEKLPNPDRINDSFLIKGIIRYNEELLDKISPLNQTKYNAVLDISIEAKLFDNALFSKRTKTLNVSTKSKNYITFNSFGKVDIVKSYPVLGSTDEMELVCTFELTGQSLVLKKISLISAIV